MNVPEPVSIATAAIAFGSMLIAGYSACQSRKSAKESAQAATRQADLAEQAAEREAKLAEPKVVVTVSDVQIDPREIKGFGASARERCDVGIVVSVQNLSSRKATVNRITVTYRDIVYYSDAEPLLKQNRDPRLKFPFIVDAGEIKRCSLEFNTAPREPTAGDDDEGLVRVDCKGAKPVPFSVFAK